MMDNRMISADALRSVDFKVYRLIVTYMMTE